MPTVAIHRLSKPAGTVDFESFVQIPATEARQAQDLVETGFDARLYVRPVEVKAPSWAPFLENEFGTYPIGDGSAPSALLLIKLKGRKTAISNTHGPYFAIPFGPTGRFLVKGERIVRGYGLRVALNLIYPKTGPGASARLRAVDSKRHGPTIMRARTQASAQMDLEAFDVNQFRDLLDRATGTPADKKWGTTISGSDAISLNLDGNIAELVKVCRNLDAAYNKPDYKDGFAWIDNIRAVTNPTIVSDLEVEVMSLLKAKSRDLHLAPPEMLDWSRFAGFEYKPDADDENDRESAPDLRLTEYLDVLGVQRVKDLTVNYLRRARVAAVDGDGNQIKWPAWRCLVGEFDHLGATYLLDEGRFFEVAKGYLSELNAFVDALDDDLKADASAKVVLPDTDHTVEEGEYNEAAAKDSADLLLLDKEIVGIRNSKSRIEICDLLSSSRRLIHVKRHLGSSTLSHLFAQGVVSAELLQSSQEFRDEAAKRVAKCVSEGKKDDLFGFFNSPSLASSEFEVVYAIAEDWGGKGLSARLPFFSKVNLREAATNLGTRGFKVAVKQIHAHATSSTAGP